MPNPEGVGGWKPGKSGNPSGRIRHPIGNLSLEARKYAKLALKTLVTICKEGMERNKLVAAREILDRGFGKSITMIDATMMTRKLNEMTPDELVSVEARLLVAAEEACNEPAQAQLFRPEQMN